MAALETKRRLTEDLIAGRLSLSQAAAAFRRADVQTGGPHGVVPSAFSRCASEEEAYSRSVIWWASAVAPRDRAGELTRRLQAELDARLKTGDWQPPDP